MKKHDDDVEQAVDAIREVLEKAKESVELHRQIDALLKDKSFEVKMSVINMQAIKLIMDEAGDDMEALSYIARFSQQMVNILDKHIEEDFFEQEDHSDEPLQ